MLRSLHMPLHFPHTSQNVNVKYTDSDLPYQSHCCYFSVDIVVFPQDCWRWSCYQITIVYTFIRLGGRKHLTDTRPECSMLPKQFSLLFNNIQSGGAYNCYNVLKNNYMAWLSLTELGNRAVLPREPAGGARGQPKSAPPGGQLGLPLRGWGVAQHSGTVQPWGPPGRADMELAQVLF